MGSADTSSKLGAATARRPGCLTVGRFSPGSASRFEGTTSDLLDIDLDEIRPSSPAIATSPASPPQFHELAGPYPSRPPSAPRSLARLARPLRFAAAWS